MIIPCYLALTAAEFATAETLPKKCAYMACHFSCYGTGLSNIPQWLPEGSILILNDRTPADRHDPELIREQMEKLVRQFSPSGVLLDFQRPGVSLAQEIAHNLSEALPCPVAVTLPYAQELTCPVFLSPPPLHTPLRDYITPYEGREVWLELATETALYIIDRESCKIAEADNSPLSKPLFTDADAFCRYHIEVMEDRAEFTLQRTFEDLNNILASGSCITKAVGLYQQLKNMPITE